MNFIKYFSHPYAGKLILVLSGFMAGWLLFSAPEQKQDDTHDTTRSEVQTWTCSMHPQIRTNKPGSCPICGMDLIPLEDHTVAIDASAIRFTEEAMALADIQTTIVRRQTVVHKTRLFGRIEADERKTQIQAAHVTGRIENLMVNFTGEPVRNGQIIARIYSPGLIAAQQELIESAKLEKEYPVLAEAAREKLRFLKITESQIAQIEETAQVQAFFEIAATSDGIVTQLNVKVGDYVNQGDVLFEIADLSTVWVLFDVYENDLPFVKSGDRVSFKVQGIPGETWSASIDFIDPILNQVNRISRARAAVTNSQKLFKPAMFVTGYIGSEQKQSEGQIVIPHTALLWTGTRSIVYVKNPEDREITFTMREVSIGSKTPAGYEVLSGLGEGEEIVMNSVFTVDAAAQLAGKTSMMNSTETRPVQEQTGPDQTKM